MKGTQLGIQQLGADSIQFFIYTNKLNKAVAKLPTDWEGNWHQLYAVYDGEEIKLMIDGQEAANAKATGNIRNLPVPLNIGRNASEEGAEADYYLCDAQIDDVRVANSVLAVNEFTPEKSVLWLDFEEEYKKKKQDINNYIQEKYNSLQNGWNEAYNYIKEKLNMDLTLKNLYQL